MDNLTIWILTALAVMVAATSTRIVPEGKRGLVYRLGRRLDGEREPGITFILPIVDRMTAFEAWIAPSIARLVPAQTDLNPEGKVWIDGQYRAARLLPDYDPVPQGSQVMVEGVEDDVVLVSHPPQTDRMAETGGQP